MPLGERSDGTGVIGALNADLTGASTAGEATQLCKQAAQDSMKLDTEACRIVDVIAEAMIGFGNLEPL